RAPSAESRGVHLFLMTLLLLFDPHDAGVGHGGPRVDERGVDPEWIAPTERGITIGRTQLLRRTRWSRATGRNQVVGDVGLRAGDLGHGHPQPVPAGVSAEGRAVRTKDQPAALPERDVPVVSEANAEGDVVEAGIDVHPALSQAADAPLVGLDGRELEVAVAP